jgi:hypothetical protein
MDYLDPFAAEHSSNEVLNLLSRLWVRKRIRSKTPGKLMLRGRTILIDRAPLDRRLAAAWTRGSGAPATAT